VAGQLLWNQATAAFLTAGATSVHIGRPDSLPTPFSDWRVGEALQGVRRAVVLAHFDRDGLLDPHVRATLASLTRVGTDILVVSTNLAATEALTGPGAPRVIRRPNAGYDFRSWQIGLRALGDLDVYQEVVLMNDSFYLAREDALVRALEVLGRLPHDVASLTSSLEFCYHLQSYFMVFRPMAIRTGWFKRFWDEISPDSDRAAAITNYELPLASQARGAGLRVGALKDTSGWPGLPVLWSRAVHRVRSRTGREAALNVLQGWSDRNPSLHEWMSTARQCGVVKVELLRDNPHGTDLSGLRKFMEPACLLRAQRHLARIASPLSLSGSVG
jgi:hypothetical protein